MVSRALGWSIRAEKSEILNELISNSSSFPFFDGSYLGKKDGVGGRGEGGGAATRRGIHADETYLARPCVC